MIGVMVLEDVALPDEHTHVRFEPAAEPSRVYGLPEGPESR